MTGIFRKIPILVLFLLAQHGVGSASAAVTSVSKSGFFVRETAHIQAKPDSIFYLLVRPARWWSSEHTFSGNASNLSVTPKAGACWCERLPDGGSVQHLQVIYVKEDEIFRLRGALGPLQALPVTGVLTWQLTRQGDATNVTVEYAISGYNPKGFAQLAKAVDSVMFEQLLRLQRAAETGSPEPGAQR